VSIQILDDDPLDISSSISITFARFLDNFQMFFYQYGEYFISYFVALIILNHFFVIKYWIWNYFYVKIIELLIRSAS